MLSGENKRCFVTKLWNAWVCVNAWILDRCGRSLMVKPQPSKLVMSVRFRSPAVCPSVTAPANNCLTLPVFKGYGDINWHFWSFILHYNCQQMPRNDTACTNSLRVLLRAQIEICLNSGSVIKALMVWQGGKVLNVQPKGHRLDWPVTFFMAGCVHSI